MAETKGTKETKAKAVSVNPEEEYVNVTLFKDGKDYKDDVFVAVNGYACQIKRGVPVQIKRKFLLALEQSAAQDIAAVDTMAAYHAEYTDMARNI